MSAEKCVLAYSGGLDTSALIPYMKEQYGYEIIAVLVDVGRMQDLDLLRERALQAGAADAVVADAREEFLREFAFPALKANALYEGRYPLHSALSRPLIAKKMVEVARERGAKVVAHGCTAKGNDQVRIDVSVRCLDPSVRVIGPARDWNMTRPELLEYLAARGIDLPLTKKNPYSIDENLWGRAIECGELEDPWQGAPPDAWQATVDPSEAPDEPVEVVVRLEEGTPISLDGKPMDAVALVERLDAIAGTHGFGRVDMVENRLVSDTGPSRARGPDLDPGVAALQVVHRAADDRAHLRWTLVLSACGVFACFH
jgi:argininosuccinate synthase